MSGRGYVTLLEDHFNRINNGEDGAEIGGDLRPFAFNVMHHEGDDNDELESRLMEWLLTHIDILSTEAEPRIMRQMDNLNFYNNIQSFGGGAIRATDQDGRRLSPTSMFFINHQRDFHRQRVSRLMRYTPTLQVFPVNNEYGDRIGARLSKRVIDNIFYVNDMRDLAEKVLTDAMLCGEQYCYVEYDPFAGDLDKLVREARQMAESEGAKDLQLKRNGKKEWFESADGDIIDIDTVKRTGEVSFSVDPTWFTLAQPAFKWKDVNYIFHGRIKHVDQIRAENPGLDWDDVPAISIAREKSSRYGPGFTYGDWQIEWEFFHKGGRFLDEGYYARFVEDKLITHGPNPYSHRGLPCARYSDIDNPWDAHGISFFEDIRPPIVLSNRLQNFAYRNMAIAGMPKIAVPEGGSNPYAMAGGPFIVPYTPPYEPKALVFRSVGGEVFQMSESFMRQAEQVGGIFPISRGDTPNNARAASILNFYEEKESEKDQSNIRKYNAFIEKVGQLSLGTAGDFYKSDDERTLRVVGKNNRYKLRKLEDVTKLSSQYDVRVERTTALAETKQGRIDQIVALSTTPLTPGDTESNKPGLFTREQILNMIEVSDTPQFFEMVTAAVDKAQSENEDMFEGIPVVPPARHDAHVVHWSEHFHFMQSREFTDTDGLPEQFRMAFLDHMRVHEAEMYMHATRSLKFADSLMSLEYFPCVYDIGNAPTIAQLVQMHQAPPTQPSPPQQAGQAPPAQAPAASEQVSKDPSVKEEPLPKEPQVGA